LENQWRISRCKEKHHSVCSPHQLYGCVLREVVSQRTQNTAHHPLQKELFFFPMNIAMKWFGSIPVRGVKNSNAIYSVAQMLEQSDEMHIIISPEGTRKKVIKWNKGFYYIAEKAKVPIVVVSIDYQKKRNRNNRNDRQS